MILYYNPEHFPALSLRLLSDWRGPQHKPRPHDATAPGVYCAHYAGSASQSASFGQHASWLITTYSFGFYTPTILSHRSALPYLYWIKLQSKVLWPSFIPKFSVCRPQRNGYFVYPTKGKVMYNSVKSHHPKSYYEYHPHVLGAHCYLVTPCYSK